MKKKQEPPGRRFLRCLGMGLDLLQQGLLQHLGKVFCLYASEWFSRFFLQFR